MIKIELSGSGDEVRTEMLKLLGLQEPKVQTESPVKEEKSEAAAEQPEPDKSAARPSGQETSHTSRGRLDRKRSTNIIESNKAQRQNNYYRTRQ